MASEEVLFPIDIQMREQIAHLKESGDKLSTRFDRHLEIYAQNGKEMAGLKKEIEGMRSDFDQINEFIKGCEERFVIQKEFWPVRMVTYGLVTAVLLAALGSVMALILK